MNMLLSFEAATAEELRDKVLNYARVFGLAGAVDTRQMDLPLSGVAQATQNIPNDAVSPIRNIMSPDSEGNIPAGTPTKRGRGRPSKAEIAAREVSASQFPVPVEEVPADEAPKATTPAESLKAQATMAAQAPADPAEAPKVEEKPAAAPTTGSATKDQAVAALQALVAGKGMPKAREVLASFNAARVSELPESKFGEFVAACNAAMVAE